jgi:TfoX/Sxy family transcriptional regulator of competence genes
MAYDQVLAQRVRDRIGADLAVTEKRMFGGFVFLWDGRIAVGIYGDGLLLRVGPDDVELALTEPGTRQAIMGGREMRGWITIDGDVLDDDALETWIRTGVESAARLPGE